MIHGLVLHLAPQSSSYCSRVHFNVLFLELVPHQQKCNDIFNLVINDLLNDVCNGEQIINLYLNDIPYFLNFLAFFGDSFHDSAVSAVKEIGQTQPIHVIQIQPNAVHSCLVIWISLEYRTGGCVIWECMFKLKSEMRKVFSTFPNISVKTFQIHKVIFSVTIDQV